MLVLSTLHELLSQVLDLPDLHTAVLLTPEGQLVSYAAGPERSKDDVLVLVGLSGETWQETREQGIGMVESELGKILVIPVESEEEHDGKGPEEAGENPIMLVALNATSAVDWEDLQDKAKVLTTHLARPFGKLRAPLAAAAITPVSNTARRPR